MPPEATGRSKTMGLIEPPSPDWACEGCGKQTWAFDHNQGYNGERGGPNWGPPPTWKDGLCKECQRKKLAKQAKRLGGTVEWGKGG